MQDFSRRRHDVHRFFPKQHAVRRQSRIGIYDFSQNKFIIKCADIPARFQRNFFPFQKPGVLIDDTPQTDGRGAFGIFLLNHREPDLFPRALDAFDIAAGLDFFRHALLQKLLDGDPGERRRKRRKRRLLSPNVLHTADDFFRVREKGRRGRCLGRRPGDRKRQMPSRRCLIGRSVRRFPRRFVLMKQLI